MTQLKADDQKPSTSPSAQYQVIAASDFSELGDRAVLEALRLCALRPRAELHVITVGADSILGVVLPGSDGRILSSQAAEDQALARVSGIVEAYLAQGQPLEMDKVAIHVAVGSASEEIVGLANVLDADVIVLGTHGRRGLQRVILGSVAEEVVKRAPCAVFVIRPRDFLLGERLPDVQPPLKPGEHALQPFRRSPTYHYVHRMSRGTSRVMPSI
jgi:nucleotide-binding universal stress UspA family protein